MEHREFIREILTLSDEALELLSQRSNGQYHPKHRTVMSHFVQGCEALNSTGCIVNSPGFYETSDYIVKEKTLKIGGFEIPAPLKEAPKIGTRVCLISPGSEGVGAFYWPPEKAHIFNNHLKYGFIYSDYDTAVKAAEVWQQILIKLNETGEL